MQRIDDLGSEAQALDLVGQLLLDQAENWFALGGVLRKLRDEGWFGECASFDELCQEQLGLKKSKAYYLIAIHERMHAADLSWEDVREVGWSKLRLLCARSAKEDLSPEEFSTRVEDAKSASYSQLAASLKASQSESQPADTTTIAFKLHEDELEVVKQALEKAKEQAGTQYDSVALYLICTEFVAAPSFLPHPVQDLPDDNAAVADHGAQAELDPAE